MYGRQFHASIEASKAGSMKKAVVDRFGRKDWENGNCRKAVHYAVYLEREERLLIHSFKSGFRCFDPNITEFY